MSVNRLHVPASLLADHDGLSRALGKLAEATGPLAEVAAEVDERLRVHAVREEALALPLLAVLPALAAGEIPDDPTHLVALARELRRELPRFLDEHIAIVGVVERLLEMGQEVDRPDAVELAREVMRHAELEEEILYPAAILTGEILESRLARRTELPL